jgi:tetratricopeptide (TPR) repeat protein
MWYDRAHNVIVDTLVMTGILGLISYFLIFAVAIVGLLRVAPRVREKKNLLFPIGMIALLATYFAQNLWVFDMISSYIVFFLSLAFIDFLISPRKEESSENPVLKRNDYLSPVFGAIMIVLTLWSFYFGNIQVARASMFTVEGLYTSLDKSIESFQKAIDASPISRFEVPEQISTRIVAVASENLENKDLLQEGFTFAENELKTSIEQNPLDYRMQLFLGRYYDNLYQFTGSSTTLELAEEVLNKAMELSPRNQQTFWSLGQTKIFQGDHDKAIELMQKAVDLEPKFANSHWYLGLTYKIAGKFDLAAKEIEMAAQLGDPWKQDIDDVKQAIDIYKELTDEQKLAELYEIGAGLSAQDTTTFAAMLAGMADSNAKIGNKEKAKLAAENLVEVRPDLATSVKSFLEELGY